MLVRVLEKRVLIVMFLFIYWKLGILVMVVVLVVMGLVRLGIVRVCILDE